MACLVDTVAHCAHVSQALRYQFYYYSLGTEAQLPLNLEPSASNAQTMLVPAGIREMKFRCVVSDGFGAQASVTTTVTIPTTPLTEAAVQDIIDKLKVLALFPCCSRLGDRGVERGRGKRSAAGGGQRRGDCCNTRCCRLDLIVDVIHRIVHVEESVDCNDAGLGARSHFARRLVCSRDTQSSCLNHAQRYV